MPKSRNGGPSMASGGSASHANTSRNAQSELTEEMQKAVTERAVKRLIHKEVKEKRIEELKNEGNQKFKDGQYLEAVELYNEAIDNHGARGLVCSNLAAAYLKLEWFEEAEAAATAALTHDPRNIKARFRRGMARKGKGHLKSALVDFETIVLEDPSCHEAAVQEKIVLRALVDEEENNDDDGDSDFYDDESSDYDWPAYDDESYESSSDGSATSDFNHIGNGVSCRFYNHGGCTKGTFCRFSHAPDKRSVRDLLGKNVCLYFLVDRCKFGAKCIYSHSKACLSHGWWDHENYVEQSQRFLDSRNGAEGPQFTIFFTAISYEHDGGGPFKTTPYTGFVPVQSPRENTEGPKGAERSSKPSVMLLALENDGMFSQANKALYDSLHAHSRLSIVVSAEVALHHFALSDILAVFVPDAAITKRKNAAVLKKLVEFTKSGGFVAVGGSFSSFVLPMDLDAFFLHAWGLPWQGGSYHRTTFSLNQSHPLAKDNPSLLKSFSIKALHVQNITPDVAVYSPTEDSKLQSMVWAPEKMDDLSESPIVHTKIGEGYFGYVGDVNGEDGAIRVTLAMLGLLKPHPKPSVASTSQIKAAQDPGLGTATGKKTENAGPSQGKGSAKPASAGTKAAPSATQKPIPKPIPKAGPSKNAKTDGAPQAKVSPQPQPTLNQTIIGNHMVPPATSQPKRKSTNSFILILSLENEEIFEDTHKHLLSTMREKLEWKQALTAPVAVTMLTSPDLAGVFVTDPGIVRVKNAHVLAKLVEFVKNGGSAVIGGLFSVFASNEDVSSFFGGTWGLKWRSGAYHRTKFIRNPSHDMVKKNPSLENVYSMKALYVGGIDPSHPVYLPVPEYSFQALGIDIEPITDHTESPAVQARIGKGYLGYIGDANAEDESTNTILAMLGLLDTPDDDEAGAAVAPAISETKVPKVPPKKTSRPFMMILSFDNQGAFVEHRGDLLSKLRAKLEILHGLSNERVVDLLASSDLIGILITDGDIANPENGYLLARLVEYTKTGGTVVIGGRFSSVIKSPDIATFFEDAWGLPWKAGEYTRGNVSINGKHDFAKDHPSLPASFTGKTLQVAGITPSMAVYVASKGSSIYEPLKKVTQAPVVHTKVGEGYLGYLGDVGSETSHTSIVLAMFGLDRT